MADQSGDIGRHHVVKKIFLEACGRPPGEVGAFLEEACGADAELRAEVESLLGFRSEAGAPGEGAGATIREGVAVVSDGVAGRTLSGRYEVHSELGRGGMGQVYLATDLRFGKAVAVKAMLLESVVLRQAFEREARLLNALRHRALPVVTDYFAERGRYFLVMDYVPGRDLGELLAERLRAGDGPFPLADVLRWADQALDALAYLHGHEPPVLHRDIKPQNMKLTPRGDAMLLDFGLAKGTADVITEPLASVAGYTPYYAPLEQMRGAGTDPRSDLYALAATLYHLLTGRVPADACARAEAVLAGREDPLAPADEIRPGIPAAVAETLGRALFVSRDRRPASAAAMREALLRPGNVDGVASGPGTATDEGVAAETVVLAAAPETAMRASTVPNNLPPQASGFVGRGAEVEEILALGAEARLVTLTGPGGIGKTRLAQRAASDLHGRFPDGIWLVELVSASQPGHVASAAAAAIGVREEAGRPAIETLVGALRDKRTLLLLDNCEHLVEGCAAFAARLLRECEGVRIVATSREPLGVGGEAVWQTPPMGVPAAAAGPEGVRESEAVRLFVDRARVAKPTFRLDARAAPMVADVCRRLDGIPLAIELAAARLKVLTLEQISSRLTDRFRLLTGGGRDAPARQQTLRAAVDWSYELLTDEERAVLRRLSVFPAGCAVEAAEAVTRDPWPAARDPRATPDVLDLVSRLVDKSLVVVEERAGEARYRMLETIREYAAEKLREAGEEDAVREAMCAWVAGLTRDGASGLNGPDQPRWVARLEAEHDTVRAALRWSLDREHLRETGMRIANAMLRFWVIRGYFAEGRAWFDEVVARCADMPPSDFSDALSGAGICATSQGDLPAARDFHERALAIAREIGEPRGLFRVLNNLAIAAVECGDYRVAMEAIEESLAHARASGDKRMLSLALSNLGMTLLEAGEGEPAVPFFEESLALKREIGERASIGYTLTGLGAAHALGGDVVRGRALLEEGLAIFREVGERRGESAALVRLARLEAIGGRTEPRATAYERTCLAEAFEIRRQAASLGSMAEVFEEVVIIASATGEPERALKLAGAAEALRRQSATKPALIEARRLEAGLSDARRAAGDAADRLLDEGRRMTLAEAAALALANEL
jgi:predicted ATPase